MPDGGYSGIPAWTSAGAWFDALLDVLATTEGELLRRAAKVARDTLLRVARADQLSADVGTGRGVATAHESVAAELGMCKKTVQRARGLLEAFGLAVTVVEGRYLSAGEREAARELHGGRQIKAASVRALTMPRRLTVENVHLPRRGHVLKKPPLQEKSPTRVRARKASASRPRAGKVRGQFEGMSPRSIDLQRFAARLVDGVQTGDVDRHLPWLLRGVNGRRLHVGALCDVLAKAGIDPARWTPRDLLESLDRWHQGERRATLGGGSRNPLRYFAWQLQQAIDPTAPTPSERAAARRAELEQERRVRAIEREQDEARRVETDPAEVARIIAQMRSEMAAEQAARRLQGKALR